MPRRIDLLSILSAVLLAVPLLLMGYFGLFSRYLADDFCTNGQLLTRGFYPSLQYWYLNWSGRYAFYFFMDLTHLPGPWFTPYLTAAAILVWFGLLFILARRLLRIVNAPVSTAQAALLALAVLLATLDGAPDLYQSLYWQTGLVTYVLPLLFLTGYAAWFLHSVYGKPRQSLGWGAWVLGAGIPLVAGGFSETYVSMQVAALAFFLTLVAVFASGDARWSGMLVLGCSLAGALLALVLVVTAPGNTVRMDFMPERMSLFEMAFWSVRHAAAFVAKAFVNTPATFLVALLVPGLLGIAFPPGANDRAAPAMPKRKKALLLVGVPLIVFLLIVVTMAPSVYATSAYPAERALVTAQFILVCGLAFWSLSLGRLLRGVSEKLFSRPVWVWLVILLLLVPAAVFSSSKTLDGVSDAQDFALQWDERDQTIRQEAAAGAQAIRAASLPHISPGLAELSKDPNDWVNQCLAQSYGVTTVIAK
jgi:hypothetical protein